MRFLSYRFTNRGLSPQTVSLGATCLLSVSLTTSLLLAGCGGASHGTSSGTSTSSGTTSVTGTGRATITVNWPALQKTSRLIPAASNSIRVTLVQNARTVGQALLVRPAEGGSGTADFNNLPLGEVTIRAVAYPKADGTGTAQAQTQSSAIIVNGKITPIDVTMQTTIDHIALDSVSPTSLVLGQAVQLNPVAYSKAGEIVLVAPGSITLKSSAPGVASIGEDGVLTANALGTTEITATETESGVTNVVKVAVTPAVYHLEEDKAQATTGTYTLTATCPSFSASEWIVLGAKPPVTSAQTDIASTLQITDPSGGSSEEITEPGGENRTLLRATAKIASPTSPSNLTVVATHKATLHPRHLVAGASTTPVQLLTKAEQVMYTDPTFTLDYTSSTFQKWVTSNQLTRQKNETEINFGRRVLTTIAAKWNYDAAFYSDNTVSELIGMNTTDSNGVSSVFVGVMRANGIPARVLAGRLTRNQSGEDDIVTYARAEYFVTETGWVPVDAGNAIATKDVDASFGQDAGNFLTLHIDPDVVLDFGDSYTARITWLQAVQILIDGDGDLADAAITEKWEVQ